MGRLTLANGRSLWVRPDELDVSGSAHFRWPNGKSYEGDWTLGKPDGVGTMTLPGGETYSGTWRAGQRHGHGEQSRADGSHYVGAFVNDVRQGEGAEQSADGLYRGSWENDLPHGAGEFFATDGGVYRGQWEAGARHGSGTFVDAAGSTYTGDWANDKPHGFGYLNATDGSTFEGGWSAGARDGYGQVHEASGEIYEGTWVANVRQGYGLVSRPDGSSYQGEWLDGKRHGQGRESAGTGESHEGTWEQNLPLGPGIRTDRSGIAISGLWNGNQVSTGLLTLPTGPEYAGPLFSQKNSRASPPLQAWLEETAQHGDPYASLFLGRLFSDFVRPEADPARAENHFADAAQAGIPEAQYQLALMVTESRPSRAIELLAMAADAGHPGANAVLGRWYLHGERVPQDPHIARRYLRHGTELGDLQARKDLAWMLATRPDSLDAERAVALIEPIARFLGDWQHLDTLAAAYAASGDFARAHSTQTAAIELAQTDLDLEPAALQQMHQRAGQYQRNEPFVEQQP